MDEPANVKYKFTLELTFNNLSRIEGNLRRKGLYAKAEELTDIEMALHQTKYYPETENPV